MAIRVGIASAVIPTSAAGATVDINVGFTPTAGQWACLVFWNGLQNLSNAVSGGSAGMGVGMAVSATSRRCVVGGSQDNATPTTAANKTFQTDCIIAAGGGSGAKLDMAATPEITNGLQFVIDVQFGGALAFIAIVINGLTGAAINEVLAPSAPTGNKTHTLTVSDPDLLIFMNPGPATTTLNNSSSMQWSFSAIKVSSGAQFATALVSRNGQASATTYQYNTDVEGLGSVGTTGSAVERVAGAAGCVSGTTLTLNWLELQGTPGNIYSCLVLKGVDCVVAQALTQLNTSTQIPVSGLGSTCLGGIVVSTCEAESAQDTPTASHHYSAGVFASASSRNVYASWDEATKMPTECAVGYNNAAVYLDISPSDAIQAQMDVDTMGTTVNFIMDNATRQAQAAFYAILIADPAAAAPVYEQSVYRWRNDDGLL